MADNESFTHTVRSYGGKLMKVHLHDWIILLLLVGIDIGLNVIEPFHRFVGEDMMTALKFPYKKHDTIPFWGVPILAVLLPILVFVIIYFKRRNVYDLHHAILGLLYAVLITGVITDAIKDAVGRPRPNFFYRCFPEGIVVFDPTKNGDVLCNGDPTVIKEGYKSFPSGHSSWSFAGLGFLAWYLAGKVQVFDRKGHAARLCLVFLPLLVATLIAISRVDDYWHHWQDVLTGGCLGLVVASFSYLQFFPPPYDAQVHEATQNEVSEILVNPFSCIFWALAANSQQEGQSTVLNSSEHHVEIKTQDSSMELEELESGRRY